MIHSPRALMTCAAALIACAAPLRAEQSAEALYTVMAGQGCMISQPEVADTFAPLGFTPDFVKETLTGLLLDGTASTDADGRLSLPPELCPPDQAAPSPRDQFVARFADAGDCTLSAGDLPGIQDDLRLDRAQLQAIATPLYEAGTLTVANGSATLDGSLCATDEEG